MIFQISHFCFDFDRFGAEQIYRRFCRLFDFIFLSYFNPFLPYFSVLEKKYQDYYYSSTDYLFSQLLNRKLQMTRMLYS